MGSLTAPVTVAQLGTHPKCPVCAVPMWLVKIVRHASENPNLTRHHNECKACDAQAVVPRALTLAIQMDRLETCEPPEWDFYRRPKKPLYNLTLEVSLLRRDVPSSLWSLANVANGQSEREFPLNVR